LIPAIVDLSLQSVGMLPEHPARHAAELLDRLMHDAAFAGKWGLEKALKKYYAVICHDDDIRPLPWTPAEDASRPPGPDSFSLKIRPQPSALSIASCRSRF